MYWLCFMDIFSHALCQHLEYLETQHLNGYYTNLFSCSLNSYYSHFKLFLSSLQLRKYVAASNLQEPFLTFRYGD